MYHALFPEQDEADSKTASPWKVSFFWLFYHSNIWLFQD